jgi:hypothetical protein
VQADLERGRSDEEHREEDRQRHESPERERCAAGARPDDRPELGGCRA